MWRRTQNQRRAFFPDRELFYCLVGFIFCLAMPYGCKRSPVSSARAAGKPLVVCTTTMIADMVKQLVADLADVQGIMKPGVDPHIYTPTPGDATLFRQADLILANGLHLEGRMIDMIEAAGNKAVELAETAEIPVRQSVLTSAPDPHVWWDIRNFIVFTKRASQELKRLLPVHATEIQQRAGSYISLLETLHQQIKQAIDLIPASQRLMVTSHDAFFYYGAAYSIEVDAVLGISTDAQANAAEPLRLAELVSRRRIPAIFHETSVSQSQNALVDSIQRLAREKYNHLLSIAGPLYSDSLGSPTSNAPTYPAAIKANTQTIVDALTRQQHVQLFGNTQ